MFLFSSPYLLVTFKDLMIRTEYVTGTGVVFASFWGVFATNIAVLVLAGLFAMIFDEYAVALLVSMGAVVFGISAGVLFGLEGVAIAQKLSSFFLVVVPNNFLIFSLIGLSVGTYYLMKGWRKYRGEQGNPAVMASIRKTFWIILAVSLAINLVATVWESVLLPAII